MLSSDTVLSLTRRSGGDLCHSVFTLITLSSPPILSTGRDVVRWVYMHGSWGLTMFVFSKSYSGKSFNMNEFWPLSSYSYSPTDQTNFMTILPILTFTELRIVSMAHKQRAWDASRKTLTPLDTWFRPFLELHMLRWLRQVFPYLHQYNDIHTDLDITELREVSIKYLRRVWHTSWESLPFRTRGSVPLFWDLLMLQLLRLVFRTFRVFSRLFALYTPRYFLDFVSSFTARDCCGHVSRTRTIIAPVYGEKKNISVC